MPFSAKKTMEFPAGSKRITGGTFTNSGGSVGGDIYTGLQKVDKILLQHSGANVVADRPVSNATFPIVDPVPIVTTANASGIWTAIGN
jgi:hypothetical protein